MPLNLYQLVKKKSHNGFKLFASQFLTNNQVVIGSYFHDEQIN